MQARREELSAGQLLHRNPAERIVDKNNHLRDCLKYLCLSVPEPAEQAESMRAREAMKTMDATSVMIHFGNLAQPPKPACILFGPRGRFKLMTGEVPGVSRPRRSLFCQHRHTVFHPSVADQSCGNQ
jgi:hypothetical protein